MRICKDRMEQSKHEKNRCERGRHLMKKDSSRGRTFAETSRLIWWACIKAFEIQWPPSKREGWKKRENKWKRRGKDENPSWNLGEEYANKGSRAAGLYLPKDFYANLLNKGPSLRKYIFLRFMIWFKQNGVDTWKLQYLLDTAFAPHFCVHALPVLH